MLYPHRPPRTKKRRTNTTRKARPMSADPVAAARTARASLPTASAYPFTSSHMRRVLNAYFLMYLARCPNAHQVGQLRPRHGGAFRPDGS